MYKWKLLIDVEDSGKVNRPPREVKCGLGTEQWWLEGHTAEEAAAYFLKHCKEEYTYTGWSSVTHPRGNGGWSNPPKTFTVVPVEPPESGTYNVIPPKPEYTLEQVSCKD